MILLPNKAIYLAIRRDLYLMAPCVFVSTLNYRSSSIDHLYLGPVYMEMGDPRGVR